MSRRAKHRKKTLSPFLPLLTIILLAAVSVTVAFLVYNRQAQPSDAPLPQVSASSTRTEITAPQTDSVSTETEPTVADMDDTETSQTVSSEPEADITDTSTVTDTPTVSDPNITTIIPPPENDGTVKRVAFTFDDGPHYQFTKDIADEFTKHGGKCTYFVVANRIHGSQGEAMLYAASQGHEIGSHSFTHTAYFNNCSDATYSYEIQQADAAIKNAIGVSPVLLRPPGGNMTKQRIAASQYSVILWNVDPKDWQYKKVSEENVNIIVNNILSTITDGDIILMHDIYSNTRDAVRILLPLLKEAGYEFVTVSELLGEYRVPGYKYYNAY